MDDWVRSFAKTSFNFLSSVDNDAVTCFVRLVVGLKLPQCTGIVIPHGGVVLMHSLYLLLSVHDHPPKSGHLILTLLKSCRRLRHTNIFLPLCRFHLRQLDILQWATIQERLIHSHPDRRSLHGYRLHYWLVHRWIQNNGHLLHLRGWSVHVSKIAKLLRYYWLRHLGTQ